MGVSPRKSFHFARPGGSVFPAISENVFFGIRAPIDSKSEFEKKIGLAIKRRAYN